MWSTFTTGNMLNKASGTKNWVTALEFAEKQPCTPRLSNTMS